MLPELFKNKIFAATLVVALIVTCVLATVAGANAYKLRNELTDTRNQLAEAIGSIEVAEGVQQRMAQENRNLRKNVEDYLGENSLLTEVLNDQRSRVQELIQIEAGLREEILFTSGNGGGTVTRTIVRNCPESEGGTTVTTGEPATGELPIYRVDFQLQELGFEVQGYTLTSQEDIEEPYAELSLRQLEPFLLDIAVAQDRDGEWSVLASEQENRLELEIAEFVIDPRVRRERWYERFGVGLATSVGSDHFGIGPIISVEAGRTYVYGGAQYVATGQQWVGTAGIAWRPFQRRD